MISLLAALTGFFSSLLPHIIQIFKDINDKRHEIAILEKQIKIEKMGNNGRLEEIKLASEALEIRELYSTYKSNISWVDAFNGSVRPVLAYAFFILYAYIKYFQASNIEVNNSLFATLTIIWSEEDQAIFAGIISFYFGQRAFSKLKK